MSPSARFLVAGLLFVAACDTGMPSVMSPATKKTSAKAKPDSGAEAEDGQSEKEARKALVERVLAAKKLAIEAVKLEGSDEVQEGMKTPNPCAGDPPSMPEASSKELGKSVACLIGISDKFADAARRGPVDDQVRIVEKLEGLAESAMARAKKLKEEQAAYDAVDAAANKVAPECEKSLPACEKRCRASKDDSGPYCLVLATIKMTAATESHDPKEVQLAADMLQIACNLKFGKDSCENAAKMRELVPKAVQAQGKAKDDSFTEAANIADDIAAKTFIMTTAAKLGGRAARQVPRMRLVIQEQTAQQFCPAKKAAIKAMGTADFNKKAAAHCKDEPPTAGGLSGPVSLPNECRAVFASVCP